MLTANIIKLSEKVRVIPIPLAESFKSLVVYPNEDNKRCVFINRKNERAKIVSRDWLLNGSMERAFALFPLNKSIKLEYLEYTMNALAVDFYIREVKNKRGLSANVLKNLNIAIIPEQEQVNVAIIEELIQQLENLTIEQKKIDAFYDMKRSLLKQIHDALCVELYASSICVKENIEIYEAWKIWIDNNQEERTIENLIHYLLTPNNPLMGAIKNLQVAVSHHR